MIGNFVKAVLLLMCCILVGYLIWRETVNADTVYTENAEVVGDILSVKTAGEGLLSHVHVSRGDFVVKGTTLFSSDDTLSVSALNQALNRIRVKIKERSRQCRLRNISELEETMAKEASIQERRAFERAKRLYEEKFLSMEDFQKSAAVLKQTELNFEIKQAEYQSKIAETHGSVLDDPETRLELEKLKELVFYKDSLSVVSPVNGYVAEIRKFANGWADKGQTVLTLVSQDDIYIAANILEKKIKNILPGQKAEVSLDIYGEDIKLEAIVKAVSPATMSTFSVIPRNNINSNWIKVSQRIPVLLELKNYRAIRKLEYIPVGANVRVKIFVGQSRTRDEIAEPSAILKETDGSWVQDYQRIVESKIMPLVKEADRRCGLN